MGNPNHDAKGRFTSGSGGGSGRAKGAASPAQRMSGGGSSKKMLGIPSPRQPSWKSEHQNDLSAKVHREMMAKKSGQKRKFGSY